MKFKFITIVLNFCISQLRNNFISTGFVCFIKLFVISFLKLVGLIYFFLLFYYEVNWSSMGNGFSNDFTISNKCIIYVKC